MTAHRVVLADDHPIFRFGLKRLIDEQADFKVVAQANDGEDLLLKLKSAKCDIVVLDLSMPKMSGMAALKEIRVRFPKVKVLVLTMQKDLVHFKTAMRSGALGYLLKDDAYDQLALAMKLVAKGKKFVSSSVSSLVTESYLRVEDESHASLPEVLTGREREILKLVASGLANKTVATKLKISIRTVETHRANLAGKLGIKNTAGLVKYALSKNIV